MTDDRGEAEGRFLDSVLAESLGSLEPPDLRGRVAAARAAGDSTPGSVARPRSGQLAAAVVLIGAAIVVGVAVLAGGGATRSEGGSSDSLVAQDPEDAGAPDLTSVEIARPQSADELRRLVGDVARMSVRVQAVGREGYLVDPEGPGGTVGFDQKATVKAVVDALQGGLRPLEPAGWEWPHEIFLHLRDGRVVRLALYWYGARLGVDGIQGDLEPSPALVRALRPLIDTAEGIARRQQGVVFAGDGLALFPADLRAIRAFDLGRDDLRGLERFADLESLDLSGSVRTLGSGWGAWLTPLPKLRVIRMRYTGMDDADLTALSCHPALEELDLTYASSGAESALTGAGFSAFRGSERLQIVRLSRATELTDEGLGHLFAVAGLRVVDLSGPRPGRATAEGLGAAIEKAERLEELDLGDLELVVTPAVMALTKSSIRHLDLGDTGVVAPDLAALPPTVQSLELARCKGVDRGALEFVAGLPQLRTLDLTQCSGLGRDDPVVLREARALTQLSLDGVKVSADGLRAIARLPLESLELSFSDVDDAGAEALAALTGTLRELDLAGCDRITDEGVKKLAEINTLTKLNLNVCDGFTEEGAAVLRFLLPDCEITWPDRFRKR